MRNWLLPESIDDVLPDEAARLEALRRLLLDHFAAHRYRLVQPPLIEHLESLLTGSGRDLDLQTFKVVDPLSGRLRRRARRHHAAGRANRRAPAERAGRDAALLRRAACCAPSRRRRAPTREVVQVGAELFGVAGHRRRPRGDRAARVVAVGGGRSPGLHLDLGHVGVYRALASGAGIAGNGDDSRAVRRAAHEGRAGGARADQRRCPRRGATRSPRCPRCTARPTRCSRAARAQLPDIPSIANALAALDALAARGCAASCEALHIDLADLRGYHYQNGAIFSVFTAGEPTADRQRRPLRRHRQGVRARAAGDRFHARPAPARRRAGARRPRTLTFRRAIRMGKNVVVIGTQWGDEGKGKIVDWLTESAQGVVRFQGGHNAGHTLVIGGTQDGAAAHSVGRAARRRADPASATASCCRRRRCCRKSASSKRPASKCARGCAYRPRARSCCRSTSRSTRRARARSAT